MGQAKHPETWKQRSDRGYCERARMPERRAALEPSLSTLDMWVFARTTVEELRRQGSHPASRSEVAPKFACQRHLIQPLLGSSLLSLLLVTFWGGSSGTKSTWMRGKPTIRTDYHGHFLPIPTPRLGPCTALKETAPCIDLNGACQECQFC